MPYKPIHRKVKTNICKVLENRRKRSAASWVITPAGESYYLLNKERIKENHFNLMFPVEVKKVSDKGENPCKIYAHD